MFYKFSSSIYARQFLTFFPASFYDAVKDAVGMFVLDWFNDNNKALLKASTIKQIKL